MKSQSPERRPIGIRGKLFASFALLTLLAVLLIWLFQIFLLPYLHVGITRERIAVAVEELLASTEEKESVALIERISREHNAGVRIFEVRGTVANTVHAVGGESGAVLSFLSRPQLNALFSAAKSSEDGAWTRFQLREGEFRFAWEMVDGREFDGKVIDERQVYARLGEVASGRTYFVLLDTPLEPIDGTVRVLNIQLLILTVVLLLLSVLLSITISKRISAPLVGLNAAARQLPRGGYPADYREEGYREVAELSATLSEAAAEIGKVDALQRELIANISHDLRTPLTMIVGYAEVMRDIEGENTPENMQVIIDEAKRLSGMVGDLVTISRYQNGAERMEKTEFSLSEEARALVGEYSALLAVEGYSFLAEIEDGITVTADRGRIVQVMRNLLDNAVNYSGERREITLSLAGREDGIYCEIRDRGEGIPEDELPNIWQRYYRAAGNHPRPTSGSGLGLAIVRENLEMHGARYGVRSTPGEGSTFWFLL